MKGYQDYQRTINEELANRRRPKSKGQVSDKLGPYYEAMTLSGSQSVGNKRMSGQGYSAAGRRLYPERQALIHSVTGKMMQRIDDRGAIY